MTGKRFGPPYSSEGPSRKSSPICAKFNRRINNADVSLHKCGHEKMLTFSTREQSSQPLSSCLKSARVRVCLRKPQKNRMAVTALRCGQRSAPPPPPTRPPRIGTRREPPCVTQPESQGAQCRRGGAELGGKQDVRKVNGDKCAILGMKMKNQVENMLTVPNWDFFHHSLASHGGSWPPCDESRGQQGTGPVRDSCASSGLTRVPVSPLGEVTRQPLRRPVPQEKICQNQLAPPRSLSLSLMLLLQAAAKDIIPSQSVTHTEQHRMVKNNWQEFV